MDDLMLKQAVQERKKGFLRRFVLSQTLNFILLAGVFLSLYCSFKSLLEIYVGGIRWNLIVILVAFKFSLGSCFS